MVRLTLVTGIDTTELRDRVRARVLGLEALSKTTEVVLQPRPTKDSHLVLHLEPTDDASPLPGALRSAARAIVAPQLKQQRGVSEVKVHGGRRPQVLVRFDLSRLAALDVTPLELAETLGNKSHRSDGVRLPTMDEIRETVIATRAGEPVRLRDLAEVRVELAAVDPGSDGSVSILVTMLPGTSARTLQAKIAGLDLDLPEGVRLRTAEPAKPAIVVWIAEHDSQQGIPRAKEARALVLDVSGVESATAQLTVSEPEVVVELREERSKALGITHSDVTATIQLALTGRTVGTVVRNEEPVELVVRAGEHRRSDLDRLKDLRIRAQNEVLVPLSSVASFQLVRVPAVLFRLGSRRAALVRIQTTENADTEEVVAAVRQAVAGLDAEVSVEWNEQAARR